VVEEEEERADCQVTWHFYIGLLAFLNGEDKKVFPLLFFSPREG
jgi:hypothetical protein